MEDIRLEKAFEAMIEQYIQELGQDTARECPIIRNMMDNLQHMKSCNNAEVRIELGIVGGCGKCPIKRR